MAGDGYTILHRKDERGVIVESGVFGPDDEVPEGFGAGEYQPVYAPREDDQEPVAESNSTPWSSPVAKGGWVAERPEETDEVDEGTPRQAREKLTGAEEEVDESLEDDDEPEDDEPEVDEGTPRQAREQSEDGESTGAEEEVDESLESDEDQSDDEDSDEVDSGTPVQAREQAGEELTGAEQEAAEDSDSGSDEPPPRGGAGSGSDAWTAYAGRKGVSIPEDASRDEIIAAVEKAGHRT